MQEQRIGQLAAWVHPAQGGKPRARIVIVHGLGEHSGRHASTADRLARRGLDVVRFDLRGNGRSSGKKQWVERFDDYLDDVDAVRDWAKRSLASPAEIIYGHSLGGAIAIHAAARRPEALRALALSAPAYLPGGGVSPLKIALGRVLAKWTPGLKVPSALDVTAISRDPAIIEAYRQDQLCCSFNTVRQGNAILGALEQVPDRCARLKMPVLIMHGSADRLVRPEGSQKLLDALATSDKVLKVFPGGYHELYHDHDREAFFSTFEDWLGRVVGEPSRL